MELLSAAEYNAMYAHMGVVFTERNKREMRIKFNTFMGTAQEA